MLLMMLNEHTMINRVDNCQIQVQCHIQVHRLIWVQYENEKSHPGTYRNSVSFGLVDNQHGQNFNT